MEFKIGQVFYKKRDPALKEKIIEVKHNLWSGSLWVECIEHPVPDFIGKRYEVSMTYNIGAWLELNTLLEPEAYEFNKDIKDLIK